MTWDSILKDPSHLVIGVTVPREEKHTLRHILDTIQPTTYTLRDENVMKLNFRVIYLFKNKDY
jgi:hypothetical protein